MLTFPCSREGGARPQSCDSKKAKYSFLSLFHLVVLFYFTKRSELIVVFTYPDFPYFTSLRCVVNSQELLFSELSFKQPQSHLPQSDEAIGKLVNCISRSLDTPVTYELLVLVS
jgi:hypothetical protein